MKIEIKSIKENPVNMLRRAGYTFQRHEGQEMSFVRSFSASGYPRFHMYVKIQGTDMIINIHLDAKKETYGNDTRHHGEYENEGPLAEEVKRLKAILDNGASLE
jgi:hypothetical protein